MPVYNDYRDYLKGGAKYKETPKAVLPPPVRTPYPAYYGTPSGRDKAAAPKPALPQRPVGRPPANNAANQLQANAQVNQARLAQERLQAAEAEAKRRKREEELRAEANVGRQNLQTFTNTPPPESEPVYYETEAQRQALINKYLDEGKRESARWSATQRNEQRQAEKGYEPENYAFGKDLYNVNQQNRKDAITQYQQKSFRDWAAGQMSEGPGQANQYQRALSDWNKSQGAQLPSELSSMAADQDRQRIAAQNQWNITSPPSAAAGQRLAQDAASRQRANDIYRTRGLSQSSNSAPAAQLNSDSLAEHFAALDADFDARKRTPTPARLPGSQWNHPMARMPLPPMVAAAGRGIAGSVLPQDLNTALTATNRIGAGLMAGGNIAAGAVTDVAKRQQMPTGEARPYAQNLWARAQLGPQILRQFSPNYIARPDAARLKGKQESEALAGKVNQAYYGAAGQNALDRTNAAMEPLSFGRQLGAQMMSDLPAMLAGGVVAEAGIPVLSKLAKGAVTGYDWADPIGKGVELGLGKLGSIGRYGLDQITGATNGLPGATPRYGITPPDGGGKPPIIGPDGKPIQPKKPKKGKPVTYVSPHREDAIRAGEIREQLRMDEAEAKKLRQYEELSAEIQNAFGPAILDNPDLLDYLLDQENREQAEFLGSAIPAKNLYRQQQFPELRQEGADTIVPTHSIAENAPWSRQPDPMVLRYYPQAKEWMDQYGEEWNKLARWVAQGNSIPAADIGARDFHRYGVYANEIVRRSQKGGYDPTVVRKETPDTPLGKVVGGTPMQLAQTDPEAIRFSRTDEPGPHHLGTVDDTTKYSDRQINNQKQKALEDYQELLAANERRAGMIPDPMDEVQALSDRYHVYREWIDEISKEGAPGWEQKFQVILERMREVESRLENFKIKDARGNITQIGFRPAQNPRVHNTAQQWKKELQFDLDHSGQTPGDLSDYEFEQIMRGDPTLSSGKVGIDKILMDPTLPGGIFQGYRDIPTDQKPTPMSWDESEAGRAWALLSPEENVRQQNQRVGADELATNPAAKETGFSQREYDELLRRMESGDYRETESGQLEAVKASQDAIVSDRDQEQKRLIAALGQEESIPPEQRTLAWKLQHGMAPNETLTGGTETSLLPRSLEGVENNDWNISKVSGAEELDEINASASTSTAGRSLQMNPDIGDVIQNEAVNASRPVLERRQLEDSITRLTPYIQKQADLRARLSSMMENIRARGNMTEAELGPILFRGVQLDKQNLKPYSIWWNTYQAAIQRDVRRIINDVESYMDRYPHPGTIGGEEDFLSWMAWAENPVGDPPTRFAQPNPKIFSGMGQEKPQIPGKTQADILAATLKAEREAAAKPPTRVGMETRLGETGLPVSQAPFSPLQSKRLIRGAAPSAPAPSVATPPLPNSGVPPLGRAAPFDPNAPVQPTVPQRPPQPGGGAHALLPAEEGAELSGTTPMPRPESTPPTTGMGVPDPTGANPPGYQLRLPLEGPNPHEVTPPGPTFAPVPNFGAGPQPNRLIDFLSRRAGGTQKAMRRLQRRLGLDPRNNRSGIASGMGDESGLDPETLRFLYESGQIDSPEDSWRAGYLQSKDVSKPEIDPWSFFNPDREQRAPTYTPEPMYPQKTYGWLDPDGNYISNLDLGHGETAFPLIEKYYPGTRFMPSTQAQQFLFDSGWAKIYPMGRVHRVVRGEDVPFTKPQLRALTTYAENLKSLDLTDRDDIFYRDNIIGMLEQQRDLRLKEHRRKFSPMQKLGTPPKPGETNQFMRMPDGKWVRDPDFPQYPRVESYPLNEQPGFPSLRSILSPNKDGIRQGMGALFGGLPRNMVEAKAMLGEVMSELPYHSTYNPLGDKQSWTLKNFADPFNMEKYGGIGDALGRAVADFYPDTVWSPNAQEQLAELLMDQTDDEAFDHGMMLLQEVFNGDMDPNDAWGSYLEYLQDADAEGVPVTLPPSLRDALTEPTDYEGDDPLWTSANEDGDEYYNGESQRYDTFDDEGVPQFDMRDRPESEWGSDYPGEASLDLDDSISKLPAGRPNPENNFGSIFNPLNDLFRRTTFDPSNLPMIQGPDGKWIPAPGQKRPQGALGMAATGGYSTGPDSFDPFDPPQAGRSWKMQDDKGQPYHWEPKLPKTDPAYNPADGDWIPDQATKVTDVPALTGTERMNTDPSGQYATSRSIGSADAEKVLDRTLEKIRAEGSYADIVDRQLDADLDRIRRAVQRDAINATEAEEMARNAYAESVRRADVRMGWSAADEVKLKQTQLKNQEQQANKGTPWYKRPGRAIPAAIGAGVLATGAGIAARQVMQAPNNQSDLEAYMLQNQADLHANATGMTLPFDMYQRVLKKAWLGGAVQIQRNVAIRQAWEEWMKELGVPEDPATRRAYYDDFKQMRADVEALNGNNDAIAPAAMTRLMETAEKYPADILRAVFLDYGKDLPSQILTQTGLDVRSRPAQPTPYTMPTATPSPFPTPTPNPRMPTPTRTPSPTMPPVGTFTIPPTPTPTGLPGAVPGDMPTPTPGASSRTGLTGYNPVVVDEITKQMETIYALRKQERFDDSEKWIFELYRYALQNPREAMAFPANWVTRPTDTDPEHHPNLWEAAMRAGGYTIPPELAKPALPGSKEYQQLPTSYVPTKVPLEEKPKPQLSASLRGPILSGNQVSRGGVFAPKPPVTSPPFVDPGTRQGGAAANRGSTTPGPVTQQPATTTTGGGGGLPSDMPASQYPKGGGSAPGGAGSPAVAPWNKPENKVFGAWQPVPDPNNPSKLVFAQWNGKTWVIGGLPVGSTPRNSGPSQGAGPSAQAPWDKAENKVFGAWQPVPDGSGKLVFAQWNGSSWVPGGMEVSESGGRSGPGGTSTPSTAPWEKPGDYIGDATIRYARDATGAITAEQVVWDGTNWVTAPDPFSRGATDRTGPVPTIYSAPRPGDSPLREFPDGWRGWDGQQWITLGGGNDGGSSGFGGGGYSSGGGGGGGSSGFAPRSATTVPQPIRFFSDLSEGDQQILMRYFAERNPAMRAAAEAVATRLGLSVARLGTMYHLAPQWRYQPTAPARPNWRS